MKRSLLVVGAVFFLLGAALTVVKLRARYSTAVDSGGASGRGSTVRAFWEFYDRAEKARLRGELGEAVSFYRKSLELDPAHQDSLFYLAISLHESGKDSEAASVLERVIELHPDDNRALTQLGTILASRAPGAEPDFDRAAELLVRSQELNREHSGPFLQQGLLELNRGNLSKAGELFRVASGGGAPESLYLAGLADFLGNDYLSAAERFVEVLEANEKEKGISGRGMVSEGDIRRAGTERDLNTFERAGIKSFFALYWTAQRLGGYPETVPESFRWRPSSLGEQRFETQLLEADRSAQGLWVDYDRDGRSDLLLIGRSGAQLLRNISGGWKDVTLSAGLSPSGESWRALQLDLDNDGWQDVYILRGGYTGLGFNSLYHNRNGQFVDVTERWGLSGRRATAAARAADFNNDGRVDLLEVGNRGSASSAVRLYMNEGSRFVESSAGRGIVYSSHGVDAAVADFESDGWQDVYILGWKDPGRLFRNTGTAFVDVTEGAGLEGVGGDGFSALFFDFNRDGRPDLLVSSHASLEYSLQRLLDPTAAWRKHTPRLFLNQPLGRFQEVTTEVGLDRCYGIMEALSGDFDSDGWADLLFSMGGLGAEHLEPSLILRNRNGRGLTPWIYLPSLGDPVNSQGAALSDTNGDGQVDLYLSGVGVLINGTR